MSDRSRRYFQYVIIICFALFVFGSAFSIALAQVSLGVSLILIVILFFLTRLNPVTTIPRWFYIWAALYVAWMMLSAVAGPTSLQSIRILKEEWLFLAIPAGIFLFREGQYRRYLLTALALGVGLVSLYAIVQHFTAVHWFRTQPPLAAPDYGFIVTGNFSHSLTFGNYFGTAALFLAGYAMAGRAKLSRWLRQLLILVSLLAMIATILSYSRATVAGMALGLILLGLIMGRKYLVYCAGIVVVMATAILITMPGLGHRFSDKTIRDMGGVYEGGRVFIWKNSLKVITDHLILGVGQGNFQAAYASQLRADIPEKRKLTHAHNDLLNIAAIAGVPGAVFFAGMWLSALACFVGGIRRGRRSGIMSAPSVAALVGSVVFLTTSLFEATFADEEVRQLLMFIWAVGLSATYKTTNMSNRPAIKNS